MSAGKNKPPLVLDMDFEEALTRFAKVDPSEIPKKRARKNTKPRRGEVKDTDTT